MSTPGKYPRGFGREQPETGDIAALGVDADRLGISEVQQRAIMKLLLCTLVRILALRGSGLRHQAGEPGKNRKLVPRVGHVC